MLKKPTSEFTLLSSSSALKSLHRIYFSFIVTVLDYILEYTTHVFHYALPNYLSDVIKRVQKRALSIYPGCHYTDCLSYSNLPSELSVSDERSPTWNCLIASKLIQIINFIVYFHRGLFNITVWESNVSSQFPVWTLRYFKYLHYINCKWNK